jgi:dihydroflavonol-4-reductase
MALESEFDSTILILSQGDTMQAFVTGSTGLLGNNLVRALLDQGYEVKALARSQRKAEVLLGDTAAQIVIGDMDNVGAFADELEGCDVLFHGAAFFREYYQPGDHWATLKRINVDAVIEIFEAAEARGVRRAIFVSSSGTVGVGPNGAPGDETAPPPVIAADNLYFRSKVLADAAVAAWLPGRKLEVVTILPGWMYGPYDAAPTSSGQIVLDFLHRKLPAIIPGAGSVVDARDVAQGMIAAVTHGRNGERYLIGGRSHTLGEIIRGLEEVSGVPAPRFYMPYPIALSAAWIAEAAARLRNQTTLMTINGIRTLQHNPGYNSSKAVAELGVTFRPLAETLRDEVAWYRSVEQRATPNPVPRSHHEIMGKPA